MSANSPNGDTESATTRAGGVDSSVQLPSPSADISPPEIPDYELIKRIGQGSYGEVWLARNVMGTYRAVKIVYRHSFQSERPFEREFDGIKRFEPVSQTHASQLKIFHVGRRSGYFYYVMELADSVQMKKDGCGVQNEEAARSATSVSSFFILPSALEHYTPRTLRSEVRLRGRLPVEECLDVSIKLTQALSHLHRHGLVHRDIKPSNIIFVNGLPKLADIGLVADTEGTLSFVGTEGYLPPEGPGKPPADIFSLGKVIYEISTGRDRNQFPELPTLWDSAPEREAFAELNEVIIEACAADVAQRYETAEQMHEDLLLVQAGKSLRRLRVMERRFKGLRRAAAVLTILAGIVTVGFLYQRRQTTIVAGLAHREATQRLRAESALTQLEIERASEMLDRGDANLGVIHLARVLRNCPTNRFVAERLMAEINQRNFLLPVIGPLQHGDRVTGARFSPDGQRIVSVSHDKTARIWDAATGNPLGEPLRHEDSVNAAQFSPDGRRIVTASKDGTARIWDAQTTQPLTAPLTHEREVRYAEFAPDAKRILTISGSTVRIWDGSTGRLLSHSIVHQAEINTAHFSPDGTRVLTASADRTAQIWDAESGRPIAKPMQHGTWVIDSGVLSAEFSPDGQRVITASADRTARIWDARTGEPLTEPLQHQHGVLFAKFSPSGQRFISSTGRTLTICDASTGRVLANRQAQDRILRQAEFSPDGGLLLTWSVPRVESWGTMAIWNAFTGEPVAELHRIKSQLVEARFDPSGRRVLTCFEDGVWIWDALPGRSLATILPHDHWVGFAQFSPDGSRLITATDEQVSTMRSWQRETVVEDCARSAWIWDARTGRVRAGPLRHEGGITSVQFSPDGRGVVTASRDHTARIWDAQTGQPLTEPMKHPEQVRFARFTPDGKQVVTSCWLHRAWLWDASTGKLVREFFSAAVLEPSNPNMPLRPEDISPDGKWLVTGSREYAQLWDIQSGEPRGKPLDGDTRVARFSPTGEWLVTGGNARTNWIIRHPNAALVWNPHTGELNTPHRKHDSGITSAQFSPDRQKLVTASLDGTARIWDVGADQPLTKPLPHRGEVLHAEFSSDSKRVVTASWWDHAGLLWDADSGLPLSNPLQHDDWVNYASFSPDGRWVVTASNDRKAKVWEIPLAPLPIPRWLPDLAEALVGKRLNEQGIAEEVSVEQLFALKQHFVLGASTDDYTRWAKWLFADRAQRTISAFSTITVPEYVEDLVRDDARKSLEEAVLLSPINGLAYARLARQLLQDKGNENPRQAAEADFYSRYAVKLSPEHSKILQIRAEVREQIQRRK